MLKKNGVFYFIVILIVTSMMISFIPAAVGTYSLDNTVNARHSGDEVDCIYGTTPITDGTMSTGEWTDANSVPISDGGGGSGTVYFKEDTQYLYVLCHYSVANQFEVYIDVNNDGVNPPQTGDVCVHSSMAFGYRFGTGTQWDTFTWGGNDDYNGNSGNTNIREMKISYSALGLTPGIPKTIGMMFRSGSGTGFANWPVSVNPNQPSTWGDMSSSYSWSNLPPYSPPILTNPQVTPENGDIFTDFTFNVTYIDYDDDTPLIKKIVIDGNDYLMSSPDTKFDDGSNFKFTTKLDDGAHNYYFIFNDSKFEVRLPLVGVFDGPLVIIPNEKPKLVPGGIPEDMYSINEDSGAGDNLIDLEEYFSDDWNDGALKFEVTFEEDASKLDAEVDGQYLDIMQKQEHWFGYLRFQVKAIDKGIDDQFGGGDDLENVSNVFKITVNPVNDAPVLKQIGYKVIVEGDDVRFTGADALDEDKWFNFTIKAADPDIESGVADTLTFNANTSLIDIEPDPWDPFTAHASFLPKNENVGTLYAKISVKDDGVGKLNDSVNIVFEIENTNDDPRIEKVIKFGTDMDIDKKTVYFEGGKSAFEDAWFNITIVASDPDIEIGQTDSITYDTNITLSTFNLDSNTGELSFLAQQSDVGTLHAQIMVSDDYGSNIDDYVNLIIEVKNINDPPEIQEAGTTYNKIEFKEGSVVEFTAVCSDMDIGYDTKEVLTYTWTSDRDGELGEGETFSIDTLSVGKHNITFTVTDYYGEEAGKSFAITINAADTGTTPDDTKTEGEEKSALEGGSLLWIIIIIVVIVVIFVILLMFMQKKKKAKSEETPPAQPEGVPEAPQVTLPGTVPEGVPGVAGTVQVPAVQQLPAQQIIGAEPGQAYAQPQPQPPLLGPAQIEQQQPQPLYPDQQLQPQPQPQPQPQVIDATAVMIPQQPGLTPEQGVTAPASPQQPPQPQLCATCGQSLSHIVEVNKYYCYQCMKYI
ncbi:MAG: hypothetical protein JSV49_06790 [Thermoplasmata archaeon]|nr:MAG: hypothetical protein JSV49_06790 [Thermoplasmata archaeon]